MEFRLHTNYDMAALTVMAKGLRKTVRKKHSRRSHVFGIVVAMLAVLLTVPQLKEAAGPTAKVWFTWAVALVILAAMVWEDKLNAYFARKRMLPGTETAESRFCPDGYTTVTAAGTTVWDYTNIRVLAESGPYILFVFGNNHAQVYDIRTLSGGTAEEFRCFLRKTTNQEIQQLR